jgi:hypothetical protein
MLNGDGAPAGAGSTDHATYIFAKPSNVREFVRKYAITSRDDIRNNRVNVAQELGFIGRVMHESNPRDVASGSTLPRGEAVDYPLAIG